VDCDASYELGRVALPVSVSFDGGSLSSDGGVLVLRDVERRLGLAERLAGCIGDRRDSSRIDHKLIELLRWRMFLIAAGYEDADDCDSLRADLVFKMAVGRPPETGAALCSQPTMSRLENGPSKVEITHGAPQPDLPRSRAGRIAAHSRRC
jgi:hypothetical protein